MTPAPHLGAAALSLAGLVASGSPRARRQAVELDRALRLPLPRTCRVAVVPTAPGCGATTTALHLTALAARARRLPALVVSASPGPASAADRLTFSRPWPPSPGALDVPAVTTGSQARELTGTGPDGLVSCLRLPPATTTLPGQWDAARRRLMRFFDLVVTETGCLPPPALAGLGRRHHAVVLVSPARRGPVEEARELVQATRQSLSGLTQPPEVVHVVVATEPGHPLVPAPLPDEQLIGYDPALGGAREPGLLRPATARCLARLAGRVLAAAAPRAGQEAR